MTFPVQKRRPVPTFREGQHWRIDPETDCWVWSGSTHRGYGRCIAGQAHRQVWLQEGNELAAGYDLHHTCRNRACVNPAHLEPIPHGRHQAQHLRRFSDEDVRLIRRLAREGVAHRVIADSYGVYWSTISKVVSGENYGDVR